MDPNLPPPAPPPMQPMAPSNNPYDFITQPAKAPRRGLLPTGGPKILIIVGVLLIVAIIAAIVIGIVTSGNDTLKGDYQTLVQQQAELIRVSAIGMQKAQQAEAKNLAVTANYSLTSQQGPLLQVAKKSKAATDPKHLALGKDPKTDAALTTAEQTNQFDEVFTKTMQTGIKNYQEMLKKIYDQTQSTSSRDVLFKDYTNATILIGNPKP